MKKLIIILYFFVLYVAVDFIFHKIYDDMIFDNAFIMALLMVVSLLVLFINYRQMKKVSAIKESLDESEQRYRSLFQYHPDGLSALDLEGNFINVNEASVKFSGYRKEQLLQVNLFDVTVPEELVKTKHHFGIAANGRATTFETTAVDFHKNQVHMMVTMIPIRVNEKVEGVYAVTKNITKSKKAQELITHLAFHDSLTGLPNRRRFEERVEEAIKESKVNGSTGSILFLDLDGFKTINDSLGHNIGDLLLMEVAERLKDARVEGTLIARYGGDEFAILLTHCTEQETEEYAQCILGRFETSFVIEGHEFFMTPSIGISNFPQQGDHVKTLMEKADIAMYQAKKQGKNSYYLYDFEHDHTYDRLPLETDLRKAIEREEFVLMYQDKIDLKTGKRTGLEALIRWRHPSLGYIPPSDFIAIAEETGLIIPIGKWALRKACVQNKLWQEAGAEPVVVSVNLSMRQLYHPTFVYDLTKIVSETGLKPNYLELEITETMTMDVQKISFILTELKKIGIKVSIDDFGTGYSSLSYLKHLPIDTLKIDQTFVRDLTSDPNDRKIVETIIGMAKNLNLRVIAEGVETKEQIDFLIAHDCDEAQGFYFTKPLDAADVKKVAPVHLFGEEIVS
ncbi:EAL domain-containing protein [Alkalihalobacillus sp. MEB130]|uniref:sensor domain-containing protein n=1 Tax=Alkalihalobacillus sp. MEB130 TaxID=2976704 RepID=UPI0028DE477C|nr:EAL domain-containing protein [Alkalihalobacillus sp. MEB130]MDT8858866.1 EAL domain-containing protein [Alkalihalobacillus sp. MEB130]